MKFSVVCALFAEVCSEYITVRSANPRRACARVTVCVYPSVTALAASASVKHGTNDTHRLFLDFDSWIFENTFRSKVIA